MGIKMKAILCGLSVLAAMGVCEAKWVNQTINLKKGWNAFYLEVTPENDLCEDIFKNFPVSQVGAYLPDMNAETAQYEDDGTPIVAPPVSYLVWNPSANTTTNSSTLLRVQGGVSYLCFAQEACSFTLQGIPQLPLNTTWRNTTDSDEMMNLVGVSLDPGVTVLARDYFSSSPAAMSGSDFFYRVSGVDASVPRFLPKYFNNKETVTNGDALGVGATKSAVWPGTLEITHSSLDGLVFEDRSQSRSFRVKNLSTNTVTVLVSLEASAREADVLPTLDYLGKPGILSGADWHPWENAVTNTLAGGEDWSFTISAVRTPSTETRAGVVRVEMLEHPSKQRFLLPIEVLGVEETETEGAFPKGLWVGTLKMSQVGFGTDVNTVKAGGTIKPTVFVHVDSDNTARLLQRVTMAWDVENEDKEKRSICHLYNKMSDVPKGYSKQRMSSVLMDTAHAQVTALAANTSGRPAKFGDELTFSFVIDEKSKENPFRHAWHPDHDGKQSNFKDATPSGDVAGNFLGKIKPESFSVTNTIRLVWRDIDDKSTFEQTPEEGTYGRVEWTLEGLRADGAIHMKGVFLMKRLSPNPILK